MKLYFLEYSKISKKEYDSEEEESDDPDLYARFQRKICKNNVVCLSEYEQKVRIENEKRQCD